MSPSRNPLMLAADGGKPAEVRRLLRSGIDLNTGDDFGETALMMAARRGSSEIVRDLLKRGAHVDPQSKRGDTALSLACWMGRGAIVDILLAAGADVWLKDDGGRNALCHVRRDGPLFWMIREAPIRRAPIREVDRALLLAALHGDAAAVRKALAAGADVRAEDQDGTTAVTHAAKRGHGAVAVALEIELLRRAPLDPPGRAFLTAALTGDRAGLESAHADLETRNPDGNTALALACEYGIAPTVRWLLDHGADVNAPSARDYTPSARGYTPLMWASLRGHAEIAGLLLAAGARVDEPNQHGETALIIAAATGRGEIVRALLRNGADVAVAARDGSTAARLARGGEIERLLREASLGRRPPEGGVAPEQCDLCLGLPTYLHADVRHDDPVPDVLDRLEIVGAGPTGQIRRCPRCGSRFSFRREYESKLCDYDEDIWLERLARVPPCDRCASLPDVAAGELPGEAYALEGMPKEPPPSALAVKVRCAACGTSYQFESDGGALSLRRLFALEVPRAEDLESGVAELRSVTARRLAAQALRGQRPNEVLALLRHPTDDVRREAAYALAAERADPAPYLEVLLALLDDPSPLVRDAAAAVLSPRDDAGRFEPLARPIVSALARRRFDFHSVLILKRLLSAGNDIGRAIRALVGFLAEHEHRGAGELLEAYARGGRSRARRVLREIGRVSGAHRQLARPKRIAQARLRR